MISQQIEKWLARSGYRDLPAWVDFAIALSNVIIILLLAWVAHAVLHRLIRAMHVRLAEREANPDEQRRLATLQRVFGYIANVVLWVLVVMLVLSEFGISIAPILATAGVAGVAVGFGAQSLVKDYFTGFVMLVENQIRVGDWVEVAGKAGLVEEVTLRFVRLRDFEGAVHFVPNGTIVTVTNRSRSFAYAVMDVGIGYRENVERVYLLLRDTARSLQADPVFADKILEDIEITGVEQWAESALMIRCRIKVVALQQWIVRREFLRRLKHSFDEHGVEIPFPHRMVYTAPLPGAATPATVSAPPPAGTTPPGEHP